MPVYVFHCSCGRWHSGTPRESKDEASILWAKHVENSPHPTAHIACIETIRTSDDGRVKRLFPIVARLLKTSMRFRVRAEI